MSIKNKTTVAQSTNYHFTFVANIFSHGLSTSPLLLMCSSWNKMRRELCLSYSSLGWYHSPGTNVVYIIIIELFVTKYDPPITVCHKLTEIICALFSCGSMFLWGYSTKDSLWMKYSHLRNATDWSYTTLFSTISL